MEGAAESLKRRINYLPNRVGYTCVDEVPLRHEISEVIKGFAEQNSLLFNPFYHDRPIWIVSEPDPQDVGPVHRLQITAIRSGEQFFLQVLPILELVDYKEHRLGVLSPVPKEFGAEFLFYDPAKPSPFLKTTLLELLRLVWKQADSLKIEEPSPKFPVVWTKLSHDPKKT